MNSLIPLRNVIAVAIALLLACSAMQLGPNAFGVVPPPDGGYPNFTTAEGTNALRNLTTGAGNSGVGWYSLFSDTIASFNTAVGVGTLLFNNADENTAVGAATLLYDQVNAMLLNEFLKEHAIVQDLKREIAALKAALQELSDQLKMSRPAQLANNHQ